MRIMLITIMTIMTIIKQQTNKRRNPPPPKRRIKNDVHDDGLDMIIVLKTVEGRGFNVQGCSDMVVCCPTPGYRLEQMKCCISCWDSKQRVLNPSSLLPNTLWKK